MITCNLFVAFVMFVITVGIVVFVLLGLFFLYYRAVVVSV